MPERSPSRRTAGMMASSQGIRHQGMPSSLSGLLAEVGPSLVFLIVLTEVILNS